MFWGSPYSNYPYAYGPDEIGTIVYVDGFNLFYGALKGTPFRWLNLCALCENVLKQHRVTQVRYFSAMVKPSKEKPTSHIDQLAYVRALSTDPRISIQWGQFLTTTKLAREHPSGRLVKIKHVEEKGSDVNIASYLMLDAAQGRMNEAVLITNDSDLVEPIRLVRGHFGIHVGVLNPRKDPSYALVQAASWVRPIRTGALKASLFPPVVPDVGGKEIHMPNGWDRWSANPSSRISQRKKRRR